MFLFCKSVDYGFCMIQAPATKELNPSQLTLSIGRVEYQDTAQAQIYFKPIMRNSSHIALPWACCLLPFPLYILHFSLLVTWLPLANFGPMSKMQPYSPSTHHCHILIQPVGHCKPHDEVGSQNLIELISGIRIGNLWMLNLTHYPIALVTPFLRVYSMKYNYLIGLIPDLRFVKNKCICFVGFCQFHISS